MSSWPPLTYSLRCGRRQRRRAGASCSRYRLAYATPRLDFLAAEACDRQRLDELEPAGSGRGRLVRQARNIAHHHIDAVERLAILVLQDGHVAGRHRVDEVRIARVVVRRISVGGGRIERLEALGRTIEHADIDGALARLAVGVDVCPQATEIEQPAAGPFRHIGIERAVDRILDLIAQLLALDCASGDLWPDRDEVIEILELDRTRRHYRAVARAADRRDIGLRCMTERIRE